LDPTSIRSWPQETSFLGKTVNGFFLFRKIWLAPHSMMFEFKRYGVRLSGETHSKIEKVHFIEWKQF